MQVYAVYHDGEGKFLLATKNNRGYFFQPNRRNPQGAVYPKGFDLTPYGGGKRALPGGGMNDGESIRGCAAREFREETGVTIDPQAGYQEYRPDIPGYVGKFAAGFFRTTPQNLQAACDAINRIHLDSAGKAARAVREQQIRSYGQLRQNFPKAPMDDELSSVGIRDIDDPTTMAMVYSWQSITGMDWYFSIFAYFLQHVAPTGPAVLHQRKGADMTDQTVQSAAPQLSQALALGQGFNVYGAFDTSSLTVPIVDSTQAGERVFRFRGVDYSVPDYVVAQEDPKSYVVKAVSENREEAQDELSVHAGIGASHGAFSGEIEATFGASRTTTADSFLCSWRSYVPLAVLQVNPSKARRCLTQDFTAAVAALPVPLPVDEELATYFDFFAAYGPFYTKAVVIGGEMSIFNSVRKSSLLTAIDLSASMQAQYDGLFTAGNLDIGVVGAQKWSAYQQASTVAISANGGDQALALRLSGADPWRFEQPSVDLYAQWADSLGSAPAIVDFRLGGVWELVDDPERARALQEAWQLYAAQMHPQLSVQTSSEQMAWPVVATPKPPIVILGTQIKPETPPVMPVGIHAIVFRADDLSVPGGIALNRVYQLANKESWPATYDDMWNACAADIQGSYDLAGNILVLATYGLDRGMPPTHTALGMLETAGAGPVVNDWIAHADAGSMMGGPTTWIGYAFSYAMVGVFGGAPGTAIEVTTSLGGGGKLTLQTFFYRDRFDGQYTIARG
ncbi:NUDIX domain-containing protein [Micromonospora sp. KC606]|uniref:MAC/perforin domain-containing protein n=1 Tax=Micromonospora sp. KC606 TaxID=2530379 RepID=UPI0010506DB8|nr:MAC/perforin domain-containing protein [Micromonospora sp. KC606]TDC83290.1 NUDIX domain-containing protein [Micromonospora sp. KC606]